MVDTGMLSTRIIKDAHESYKRFVELEGTHYSDKIGKRINENYSKRGITAIFGYVVEGPNDKLIHILIMRVNFRILSEGSGVMVGSADQVPLIEKNFDAVMAEIGLPSFDNWSVLRLDYCYNIYTPDVDIYLKLLLKGQIPRFMKERYLITRKRQGQEPGSLYLIPGIDRRETRQKENVGSRNINFYDKQLQLSRTNARPELVASAENVLRLEVQTFKRRLKAIKDKYKLPSMSPRHFLNDEIAAYEVRRALKDITRSEADYMKKSTAVKLIQARPRLSQESKSLALELINEVMRHRQWSLAKAKQSMGKNKFDRALDILGLCGVNPICISDKECSPSARNPINGLKDNRLQSLFSLLDQAVEEEKSGTTDQDQGADQESVPEIELQRELSEIFTTEEI